MENYIVSFIYKPVIGILWLHPISQSPTIWHQKATRVAKKCSFPVYLEYKTGFGEESIFSATVHHLFLETNEYWPLKITLFFLPYLDIFYPNVTLIDMSQRPYIENILSVNSYVFIHISVVSIPFATGKSNLFQFSID